METRILTFYSFGKLGYSYAWCVLLSIAWYSFRHREKAHYDQMIIYNARRMLDDPRILRTVIPELPSWVSLILFVISPF
jgi:hypothetical protein